MAPLDAPSSHGSAQSYRCLGSAHFDVPTTAEHLEVRLIDRIGDNPNLDFVLYDTPCARSNSSAPRARPCCSTVCKPSAAPRLSPPSTAPVARASADQALSEITDVLPGAEPNYEFDVALL